MTDFYESDEVSRMMPGKEDFVSVRQEGIYAHTYSIKVGFKQGKRGLSHI